jgi:hypothetical protein
VKAAAKALKIGEFSTDQEQTGKEIAVMGDEDKGKEAQTGDPQGDAPQPTPEDKGASLPKEPTPPVSLEEYIRKAPDHIRGDLEAGYQAFREERESLIKGLRENEACGFSEEDLKGMPLAHLRHLSKLAKGKEEPDKDRPQANTDYSGAGGAPDINKEEEPLLPPSFEDKPESEE